MAVCCLDGLHAVKVRKLLASEAKPPEAAPDRDVWARRQMEGHLRGVQHTSTHLRGGIGMEEPNVRVTVDDSSSPRPPPATRSSSARRVFATLGRSGSVPRVLPTAEEVEGLTEAQCAAQSERLEHVAHVEHAGKGEQGAEERRFTAVARL